MAAPVLTLRQLNRATLARQMLLERSTVSAVDAVERLVAMQAQLARPPYVGLWTRLAGFQREALTRELTRKRIVRATSLRGTLHLMSARDFNRFRTTLQAGLDKGLAVLGARGKGIDFAAADATGLEFFNEPQTFDTLRDALTAKRGIPDIRAMAYAIRLRTPLVQVPSTADWGFPGQASFVRSDVWLGKAVSSKDALADLVVRYLAAYGPSSIADAQSWLGQPNLRAVFDALRPRLMTLKGVGRGELFDLEEAPRPSEDVPSPVRFLPDYDSVIVGRADARILPIEHRKRVFLPGLRVLPTVLVDGTAVATWSMEKAKNRGKLTIQPFSKLTPSARKAIEPEAAALAAFLEPGLASDLDFQAT